MVTKLRIVRWFVKLSNLITAVCGLTLLAIAIWTMEDKSFLDELLRNRLFLSSTTITLVCSCAMVLAAAFGGFAAFREVKCLLVAHIIMSLVILVCLLMAGVTAFVFKEQVNMTMKAEMIADIRKYDPTDPSHPVTAAWDLTQRSLSCCGLMTEQVSQPWQMWRYNRELNPTAEYQVVPASCCQPSAYLECMEPANRTAVEANLLQGDCYELAHQYIGGHASFLGTSAIVISLFLILNIVSSYTLFRTMV